MLEINYIIMTNDRAKIHFYSEYLWIGHYDIESKDLFIPMDYRQEATEYLKTVGLEVKNVI